MLVHLVSRRGLSLQSYRRIVHFPFVVRRVAFFHPHIYFVIALIIAGLIGKWHLGLNCNDSKDRCHHPHNKGFQEYYGLPLTNIRGICGSREYGSPLDERLERFVLPLTIASLSFGLALAYIGILSKKSASIFVAVAVLGILATLAIIKAAYSRMICVLMRGFDVVEQPVILENLTMKFTNEAKHFIHSHKDEPFLLFMSYVKVHTSLFSSPKFRGHSVHGRYGDNVEEMDWSVGEIISTLEEQKILDNTFVYFTSDHGPHLKVLPSGEYCGGWKGMYSGGKL